MNQEKINLVARGVIRTDQEEWIIGYAKFIWIGTVEMDNAWSLPIGLKIAVSLNVKKKLRLRWTLKKFIHF